MERPGLAMDELERYDRQIKLLGLDKQMRLARSKVLVLGVGGLGSPAAMYLAAAGVGELVLVDYGTVELSNLNRQILYTTKDIGKLKVMVAAERLRELNPNVRIKPISSEADEKLLESIIPEVDVVIDGLDSWRARFAVNRVCVKHRKPFIHAGVQGVYGQLLVVIPGKTPCLRCIMPREPQESELIPVLGPTPGLLAMIQVTETIKLLTGYGNPALNKLIVYDGYNMMFHVIPVERNPNCPVCGELRGD